MKRRVALTIVLVVFSLAASMPAFAGGLAKSTSKNAEAQKLIDKAWALDKSDSSSEISKQCVSLMEQADKLDPNNLTILVELSRYYFSYGDSLPKQTPEQQKILVGLYNKGMAAAEKALKIKESVPAHYWYAVNKAASLEFSSIMAQAAGFPAIYSHAGYVKKNDPTYFYGANGRLWAEIITRVPRKVVEMVGQKYVTEAEEEMARAIKAEPRYVDNYVYKARFTHVWYKSKDDALKLLETALKIDPNSFPEEVTANKVGQRNGKILWKKITGKDYPQK